MSFYKSDNIKTTRKLPISCIFIAEELLSQFCESLAGSILPPFYFIAARQRTCIRWDNILTLARLNMLSELDNIIIFSKTHSSLNAKIDVTILTQPFFYTKLYLKTNNFK